MLIILKDSTIKDVAKEAGVSIATVSRVLNNKNRVSESARKRVIKAIEKLGYTPDPIARTMIKKQTKSVGLLVPTLQNEYWAHLAEVIQNKLWEKGYTLMLCTARHKSISEQEQYLKSFIERRMDGIIVGALDIPDDERMGLPQVIRRGIPVVAFEKKIPGVHRVAGDDISGAQKAVEHLIMLGHTDIAYLGPCDMEGRDIGYRNAHSKNNIMVNESLLFNTSFNVESGYSATLDLLKRGVKFTAIFCANDLIAFGAIRALLDLGKSVPGDIAVVGYDDITKARFFNPRLTTVAQPIEKIGETIVELLMETIEKGNVNPRNIIFDAELVVRESCGAKKANELKQIGF